MGDTNLEPIKYPGGTFLDDRGTLKYNNTVNFNSFHVQRTYLITGQRGVIRAWHGHKVESKIFQSVKGEFRLHLVNMETEKLHTFFLHDCGDCIVVPAGFYNGFQHLSDDSSLLVYSNTTTNQSLDDDYREDYSEFVTSHDWSLENYR